MTWRNDQVSSKETEEIARIAKEQLEVEGDFVEMGCYRGDTSLMLAEILREGGLTSGEPVENSVENREEKQWKSGEKSRVEPKKKKLWIYDSFEGLPEKTEKDQSALGEDFQAGELLASRKELKKRFLRANLPVPIIRKGWFNELEEEDLPSVISLAFLDGDLYESIRDSLRLVTKKMAEGGVILVHDYTNLALPGVKEAVEEWNKEGEYRLRVIESMVEISGFKGRKS